VKTVLKFVLRVQTTVGVTENREGAQCMIDNHIDIHHSILSGINVIQTSLPIAVTVGLNIKLLLFARKKFRTLPHNNKTAILTTASICMVLLASHTVREVTEILQHGFGFKPSFTVRKLSTCLYYLNAFCNFIVYIMANKGFRKFAVDVVRKKKQELSATLSSRFDFGRSSTRRLLYSFIRRRASEPDITHSVSDDEDDVSTASAATV
jgi:Na+/H+-dicarboxylate symporter